MTDGTSPENRDWFVPAILVAIVLVLAVIIGVVVGIRATGRDDDSVAAQLERWSSCLRSEGANVPLVESLRGGGFRVTVDGSLIDEGLDRESLGPALDSCKGEAPDGIRQIMSVLDTFPRLPFDELDFGAFGSNEAHGLPFGTLDDAPRDFGGDRRSIAEVCERIEQEAVDEANIPRWMQRACRHFP